MIGRADRHSDEKSDRDDRGQGEASADAVRALLLFGADRGLDVRGMDSAMVAAVRSIVNAGARDSDDAAHPARTHRDVGAAHSDGQTRPRLGEVNREAREYSQPAVESKVTHRRARPIIAQSHAYCARAPPRL